MTHIFGPLATKAFRTRVWTPSVAHHCAEIAILSETVRIELKEDRGLLLALCAIELSVLRFEGLEGVFTQVSIVSSR